VLQRAAPAYNSVPLRPLLRLLHDNEPAQLQVLDELLGGDPGHELITGVNTLAPPEAEGIAKSFRQLVDCGGAQRQIIGHAGTIARDLERSKNIRMRSLRVLFAYRGKYRKIRDRLHGLRRRRVVARSGHPSRQRRTATLRPMHEPASREEAGGEVA
jgi:hypothetical protein